MKYSVVYFSRTGISRRAAEKIAKNLGCELVQITDDQNWNGWPGFIKGGFYATINKTVKITLHGSLDDAGEYIVVAPLWAGGLAPAARAFLKTVPAEKVHLVVTSDGSQVKDRSGFKSVSDVINSNDDEDAVINCLVESLA
jgi:hypothetical protein